MHKSLTFNSRKLAALIFVTCLFCVNARAQFQPMRLLSGVFEIAGNAVSNIPAACVNESLRVPVNHDYYGAASEGIYVTRIEGAREVTKPLSEALNTWVRIRGNRSITSVAVEPVRSEPDVRYRFNVAAERPGLVTNTKQEIPSLLSALTRQMNALTQIDTLGNRLKAAFGKDSDILERFSNEKSELEWDIIESANPAEASAEVKDFQDEIRAEFGLKPEDGRTPQERLQTLSILHGDFLTPGQITRIEQTFDVKLGRAYDDNFSAGLSEYVRVRRQLSDAFGADHDIAVGFRNVVVGESTARFEPSSLKEAVEYAKKNLLDDHLQRLPDGDGSGDVVSLYYGTKINDRQAQLINQLTGRNIKAATGKLDDCVLLSEVAHGDLYINTTSSYDIRKLDELGPAGLRDLFTSRSRVVVDGDISDGLAGRLREAGVGFVRRFEEIVREPSPSPKRVKLIFVTSDNPEIAGRIFEGQDLNSIMKANQTARSIPNSVVAENRSQLDNALRTLKPDEKGVVVFHDGEDGIMVDKPMGVEELAGEGGDGLSCNTYKYADLGYPTTHELDFETTVEALSSTAKKYGESLVSLDDFMKTFHDSYERQSVIKKLYRKALIAAGTIGAAGVVYIVHVIASGISEDHDAVPASRKTGRGGLAAMRERSRRTHGGRLNSVASSTL